MSKSSEVELRAYQTLIEALQAGQAAAAAWHALWDACDGDEEPDDEEASTQMLMAEDRIEAAILDWQRVVLDGGVDAAIGETVDELADLENRMRSHEGNRRYMLRFGLVIDAIRRALET